MEIKSEEIKIRKVKACDKKILDIMHQDLKCAKNGKEDAEFMIEESLDLIQGKNVVPNEDGRSKVVSQDMLKQTRWANAQMLAPFKTEINPISVIPTNKDVAIQAEMAQELLNYQCKNKLKWVPMLRRFMQQFINEGSAIGKVVWRTKTKEVITFDGIMAVDDFLIVKANEPDSILEEGKATEEGIKVKLGALNVIDEMFDIEMIPFENFFPDPTATKITPEDNDCDFVIERRVMTLSQALHEGEKKGWKNLEKLKKVFEHQVSFDSTRSYGNNNKPSTTEYVLNDFGYETSTLKEYRKTMLIGKDATTPKGEGRDKIAIYVAYSMLDLKGDGNAVRCEVVFSGDILLKCEQSTYPDDDIPYIFCSFDPTNNSIYGTPFYKYIKESMQVRTALLRLYIDSVGYGVNGRYLVQKGSASEGEIQRIMEGTIGDVVEVANIAGIRELTTASLPPMHFSLFEMFGNEIEHITGFNSIGQGMSSKYNGTASGISMTIQAGQQRIDDNISIFVDGFLKPAIKLGHKLNVENLSEQTFTSVVGKGEYTVGGKDLDVDVDIDIVFNLVGQNDVRIQQIIQIMSQVSSLISLGIVSPMILTEMFKKLLSAFNFKDIEFMIDSMDSNMPNGKKSIYELVKASVPDIKDDEAMQFAEALAQADLQEIQRAMQTQQQAKMQEESMKAEEKEQNKQKDEYYKRQAERRKQVNGETYYAPTEAELQQMTSQNQGVNVAPTEISQKRFQQEATSGFGSKIKNLFGGSR